MASINISDDIAQVAEIAPVAQAAGTVLSGAFRLNKTRSALAIIQVGTPGAGGTVDAKFRGSATLNGTYADVTGATMTQMIGAGTQMIEIRGATPTVLSQGPFYKLSLTVGVATTPIAVHVQGQDSRFAPNSDYNDPAVLLPAVVV